MRRKTGYVQNRGTSFRIAYYTIDHIRQFETFATEEEARRELAIRLAEIAQGIPVSSKPNTVKFGELCDDVVTYYETCGHKSVDDIETRYRLHIIPVFGDRKAVSITASQLRQYVVRRQAEEAKHGTIARELEAIRRAFLLAKKEHKFLGDPPAIPKLPENRREGFFTRAEVDRLCSHLKPPLDSFVLFAFLTGWRLEEIRGLRWSNIDFAAGEIRLDAGSTKTGEPRVFPMTDELRSLLSALKPPTVSALHTKKQTTRVVTAKVSTITNRVFLIGAFRKTWKTACHKAGLPCIVVPVKKGGKRGAVKVVKALRTFHDLRRSGAREMSNQGVPQPVIMALMGHATDSMFQRYRIVSADDKKRAAEIVNRAKSGAKEGREVR